MLRSPAHGLARGSSLCHQNIRLAEAIGIGNHADDHKAAFLVEREGMTAQIADGRHMRPDIWIEIDTAVWHSSLSGWSTIGASRRRDLLGLRCQPENHILAGGSDQV